MNGSKTVFVVIEQKFLEKLHIIWKKREHLKKNPKKQEAFVSQDQLSNTSDASTFIH